MLLVIKFNGQERAYNVEDVDGWKNAIISLSNTCTEFTVSYRFK